jgi:hypothetical protein
MIAGFVPQQHYSRILTHREKEWSYASMFFDLTGAAASHASVGDPAIKIVTPLIIVRILIASWAFRLATRRIVMWGPREDEPPVAG